MRRRWRRTRGVLQKRLLPPEMMMMMVRTMKMMMILVGSVGRTVHSVNLRLHWQRGLAVMTVRIIRILMMTRMTRTRRIITFLNFIYDLCISRHFAVSSFSDNTEGPK